MTRMTPFRFTILQFSQSFFTEARTFINSVCCFYRPLSCPGTGRTVTLAWSPYRPPQGRPKSLSASPSRTPSSDGRSAGRPGTNVPSTRPLSGLQPGSHLLGPRQNLRLAFGDQHRVFKVRGGLAIPRHHCPVVAQNLDVGSAGIDHWF